MAGVSRNLVLVIDHVHLLVGVVHEYILGALFLDALGRASRVLVVAALRAAITVRNVSGPAAIGAERNARG